MNQCSICSDPRVQSVDAALAAGRSARGLAIELGLGPESMKRHARHAKERAATPVAAQSPGVDALDELVAALRTRAIGGDTAAAREYRLALAAQTDRSMGKTEPYNVDHDPEWIELRTLLYATLKPHPDAWTAVRDALRARELARPEASQ